MGCACQSEWIVRHNYLRDALYCTAVSAHFAPLRKERALLPNTDRPADMLVPNFSNGGNHMTIDVCGSNLQA